MRYMLLGRSGLGVSELAMGPVTDQVDHRHSVI